jgi:hypothetical protein
VFLAQQPHPSKEKKIKDIEKSKATISKPTITIQLTWKKKKEKNP